MAVSAGFGSGSTVVVVLVVAIDVVGAVVEVVLDVVDGVVDDDVSGSDVATAGSVDPGPGMDVVPLVRPADSVVAEAHAVSATAETMTAAIVVAWTNDVSDDRPRPTDSA